MEHGAVSVDGGWYEKHAGSVKEGIVKKVVCDGFPEVWSKGSMWFLGEWGSMTCELWLMVFEGNPEIKVGRNKV